jgi:hypothetical protein
MRIYGSAPPRGRVQILAISTAGLLMAAVAVDSARGAVVAPMQQLTKSTAATIARRDAEAAVSIGATDKVSVSACRATDRSGFKCAVVVLPGDSISRCHWTETIRLNQGSPAISYGPIVCSSPAARNRRSLAVSR